MTNPVFSWIISVWPSAFNWSAIGEDWRDCQTIAFAIGWPVVLSQTTVVSRWLVMPMPAIASGRIPDSINAPAMTDWTEFQISLALCSTQPDFGKYCGNSFCELPIFFPLRSKK